MTPDMENTRVKRLSQKALVAALRRLTAMLGDEETSAPDAIKAASLVFDKLYHPEDARDAGPVEIRLE